MKKAVLLIVILLAVPALWAQNRYALVIGNANYPPSGGRDNSLPNAINDTNAVSAALRELGFDPVLRQNLNRLDMVKEISAFMTKLRSNQNSEGFLWYAGHAIEINGENLLLPLDVNVESDELIRATSFSLNDLTRQFGNAKNKINVLVLDACRVPPSNNRSRGAGDTTRVLKTVQFTPSDLFVIYSTAPGTEAQDGTGNRSPFAESFLKHIGSTEPLQIMMGHVTSDTLSLTGHLQRPYISGSMGKDNAYYSLGVRPENPVPVNMVHIQGGTFTMGSPANEAGRDDDEIQRQVTVSSFYMEKYEVTQREYQEVMGTNHSNFKGDNLPVERVSWYDAIEYCNARSRKEGLTPAYTIDKSRSDSNNTSERDTVRWLVTRNPNANGYRLPTEAEWEYACRAGTRTPFSTGNNITTSLANYNGNYPYIGAEGMYGAYREKTAVVGSFAPNPWGLHDMHGNVVEWCWDWYGKYASGSQTDPVGASSGSERVLRGGSWYSAAQYVRSAYRHGSTPTYRSYDLGFRVARNGQ